MHLLDLISDDDFGAVILHPHQLINFLYMAKQNDTHTPHTYSWIFLYVWLCFISWILEEWKNAALLNFVTFKKRAPISWSCLLPFCFEICNSFCQNQILDFVQLQIPAGFCFKCKTISWCIWFWFVCVCGWSCNKSEFEIVGLVSVWIFVKKM